MIKKTCLFCKKVFYVKNYRKSTAHFCRVSCSAKYNYKKKLLSYDKHGKNHPNWKGGRKINSQGYILIYSPNHPHKDKSSYVREHRLIVEKKIKRFLLPIEVIHHINGIKTDNRIENLKILKKKKHDALSAKERSKTGLIKICPVCQNKFYTYKSHNCKFCSRNCLLKSRWKNGWRGRWK